MKKFRILKTNKVEHDLGLRVGDIVEEVKKSDDEYIACILPARLHGEGVSEKLDQWLIQSSQLEEIEDPTVYKTLSLSEEEFDVLNVALIEQWKWERRGGREYIAEILDRIQSRMNTK